MSHVGSDYFKLGAGTNVLETITEVDYQGCIGLLSYKTPSDGQSESKFKTKDLFVSPLRAYHDVSKLRAQIAYCDFSIVCDDGHKIPWSSRPTGAISTP